MTIGIDATRANQTQKTGVERYAFELIQALKIVADESIQVILYSDKPLEGELGSLPKNWESRVLRWKPKRLWTQIRLSYEMLMRPPSVLFIPGHVFPIIHPKKTVMTVHDIAAWRFPETYSSFERWYSLWSASYAAQRLWRVIVPTQFGKEELCSYVREKKKKIISGNTIIPIFHGPTGTDNKISPTKKPYLFFCGRIEEKKNLSFLIRTFSFLKQNYGSDPMINELSLLLVGNKGFGGDKVFEEAQASAAHKQIHFLGFIPDKDRDALMAEALLFVYLSKYEGFGMPILEAWRAGVPAVISGAGALREVGGDAVVVCNGTDAQVAATMLYELIQNAPMRLELVQKGKERLAHFSWQKTAQETLKILVEL